MYTTAIITSFKCFFYYWNFSIAIKGDKNLNLFSEKRDECEKLPLCVLTPSVVKGFGAYAICEQLVEYLEKTACWVKPTWLLKGVKITATLEFVNT